MNLHRMMGRVWGRSQSIPHYLLNMVEEMSWHVSGWIVKSNAAKLIGQCFAVQMDNDPKHTAKAAQDFLKTSIVK